MSDTLEALHARMPRLEPAFLQALAVIQQSEQLTLNQLLGEISRQRGATLCAKARIYALDYYRNIETPPRSTPGQRQNSPLHIALSHVRGHGRRH